MSYKTKRAEWMMFVDGENITREAQKLHDKGEIELIEGKFYRKNAFVWFPCRDVHDAFGFSGPLVPEENSKRSNYYTSYTGSQSDELSTLTQLKAIGFDPKIFKKPKGRYSKGVDISLTTEALINTYNDNFDICVLVSGDADYVPLVNEIKRHGKLVYISFLSSGFSDSLKLAADATYNMDHKFKVEWQNFKSEPRKF